MKIVIAISKVILTSTAGILLVWIQVVGLENVVVFLLGDVTESNRWVIRLVGAILGFYLISRFIMVREIPRLESELVLAKATIMAYETELRGRSQKAEDSN